MKPPNQLILLALYYAVPHQTSPLDDPDFGLNAVEMIKNHGYLCESHTIVTEDGYILTYHRIPHGTNNNTFKKKTPVLLVHGLLASSAEFVSMGPNRSLSYILADEGYDVWLANCRGTTWSRKHVKLDIVKDAEKFFDFSWHEIGYYDLPAAIDYILNITGHSNLFFVGHSQGGTAFLVLASTRPEYNRKVKQASLMAPAAFMENHANVINLGMVRKLPQLQLLAQKHKVYEVPYVQEIRSLGTSLCPVPTIYPICEFITFAFFGFDHPQFDYDKIGVILTNTPAYSTLKQYYHYGQLIRNGGFSQYDYGKRRNVEIYGSLKPPSYNISKITASVAVYYGRNDDQANFKDVRKLISKLPNVTRSYLVPYSLFNHIDFIYAKDVVKLLYAELI